MTDEHEDFIPVKIRNEIYGSACKAMQANAKLATELHEKNGLMYSMCSNAELAIRGWMLHDMMVTKSTPEEAIANFMNFLTEAVIPAFYATKSVEKLTGGKRNSSVRMFSANSMEELVTLVEASKEAETATKQ